MAGGSVALATVEIPDPKQQPVPKGWWEEFAPADQVRTSSLPTVNDVAANAVVGDAAFSPAERATMGAPGWSVVVGSLDPGRNSFPIFWSTQTPS